MAGTTANNTNKLFGTAKKDAMNNMSQAQLEAEQAALFAGNDAPSATAQDTSRPPSPAPVPQKGASSRKKKAKATGDDEETT
jgi:hypothetical protein